MDMFGFSFGSVKKFETRYLDSKNTGMTIEDFEANHLRNTVHAFYMAQDVTQARFAAYQEKAMQLADTPEGDEAAMSAGFLVGINDGIHNSEIAFSIFSDLKRKQVQGWSYLIGDERRQIIGAVECLNEYAKARKLSPQEILAKFPRDEFEREFAAFQNEHRGEDA